MAFKAFTGEEFITFYLSNWKAFQDISHAVKEEDEDKLSMHLNSAMEEMTPSLKYARKIGLEKISQQMQEVTTKLYQAKEEENKQARQKYIEEALAIAEPAFEQVEAIKVRIVEE